MGLPDEDPFEDEWCGPVFSNKAFDPFVQRTKDVMRELGINKKDVDSFIPLDEGTHIRCGAFQKHGAFPIASHAFNQEYRQIRGCWYPLAVYMLPGTFFEGTTSRPSKNFPHVFIRYWYSKRYSAILACKKPHLWGLVMFGKDFMEKLDPNEIAAGREGSVVEAFESLTPKQRMAWLQAKYVALVMSGDKTQDMLIREAENSRRAKHG